MKKATILAIFLLLSQAVFGIFYGNQVWPIPFPLPDSGESADSLQATKAFDSQDLGAYTYLAAKSDLYLFFANIERTGFSDRKKLLILLDRAWNSLIASTTFYSDRRDSVKLTAEIRKKYTSYNYSEFLKNHNFPSREKEIVVAKFKRADIPGFFDIIITHQEKLIKKIDITIADLNEKNAWEIYHLLNDNYGTIGTILSKEIFSK